MLARLVSWFLLLLAGLTADLTGLAEVITRAPVIFPSDAALKIQLPEWVPRERGQRDTNKWSHKKTLQIGGARRGEEILCLLSCTTLSWPVIKIDVVYNWTTGTQF